MPGRNALMIYFDVYPAIRMLSDEDSGKLLKAMLSYTINGEVPEFDGTLAVVWALLQPRLDYDGQRYEEAVRQKKYAVYCREEKKSGKKPLPLEEWKTGTDNGCYHAISDDNGDDSRYPSTSTSTNTNTYSNTYSSASANRKAADDSGSATPTREELFAFCAEHAPHVEAAELYERYSALSWTDGNGQPIRNWRYLILSLERTAKAEAEEREKAEEKKQERIIGSDDLVMLPNGNFVPYWEAPEEKHE